MRNTLGLLLFLVLPLQADPLPWQREEPLRDAAKSVFINGPLAATDPQPGGDTYPRGPAFQISNPSIRSTLWGPADRVTLSLLKNDIWDRRVPLVKYTSPTLDEIIRGANAPINRDATDILPNADSTRPGSWGYLRPEGGRTNPYSDGPRYPFPTAKPTGQIILGFDALKGAPQPELAQNCADGAVRFQVANGPSSASLEYVLAMEDNVYAIRGTWQGAPTSASLRLYRHRDTSYLGYMTPDGLTYKEGPKKASYEAERDWNGPVAPPESGSDGKFFWIRQTMPAEKTFPAGFSYVMVGMIRTEPAATISTVENQTGLGTPVPDKAISAAPGAAATATFPMNQGGKFDAYIVTVTCIDTDGGDIMAEARRRLEKTAAAGFDGVVSENAKWYSRLYDRRESGRIFLGSSGTDATDDLRNIFNSWYCPHDGGTRTDMRKFQASAHYVTPEHDGGMYGSLPCYNEVFYTPDAVRNRSDATLMWKEIVAHWFDASKANARETYGMPGMFLTHGFLPPIKPDRYVHTNVGLELSVETMAQVYKTLWDEWDYGADPKVLEEIYPAMREMAIFYAAYAKKGADGFYHIIPSSQEESWGLQPGFSHNKDTIAAISMFRWAFTRTAEAARLLKRDEALCQQWLEVAAHLPPYPTWQKPEGTIFAAIPGVEPWRGLGEHPWDIGMYPTVLADDINLDSPARDKDRMLLTVKLLRAGLSDRAEILLGENPEDNERRIRLLLNLPEKVSQTIALQPNTEAAPGSIEQMLLTVKLLRDNLGDQEKAQLGDITGEKKQGPERSVTTFVDHPERLLNSRSGRIHLFPTLPANTGPSAFRHFQARGGFLVSACHDGKKVTFLELSSRRDLPCQLMNPWPGKAVTIQESPDGPSIPYQTDLSNGECLVFATQAGKNYLVSVDGK